MSQRLHHCLPTPLTPSCSFPGSWSWTLFFFFEIFVCFLHQVDSGLVDCVLEGFSQFSFWKEFEKAKCYLFCECLKRLPVKLSGLGPFVVGGFLITVSISVLMIGLFIFSVSSWFSLERLYQYFSQNLSISST